MKVNSNILILQEEFESLEIALQKIAMLNYGTLNEAIKGNISLDAMLDPTVRMFYYKSETDDAYYKFTIEGRKNYKLSVYVTYKHKMVLAAQSGDLELFVRYFKEDDNLKYLSIDFAISNNRWNIVEYLIENSTLVKDPIWLSIKWNNLDILNKLLNLGHNLPDEWLAYCVYNNSLEITQELLLIKKKHLEYSQEDLNSNWLKKELLKDTLTSKLVKKVLGLN